VTPASVAVDAAIAVPTAAVESTEQVTSFVPRPAPTSLGPTGDSSQVPPAAPGFISAQTIPAVARIEDGSDQRPANPQSENGSPSVLLNQPAQDFAPGPYATPYPTTDFPDAPLPAPIDGQLPQVRTSDAPPAVARLRGDIHAIPPR
jgi:hypothetical protein